MTFENTTKEKLLNICKNINEEHIIKAIEYIQETNIPDRRNSSTHFIIYKDNKYPLKYILEIANNHILNNNIKIGPETGFEINSYMAANVLQTLIQNPKNFIIETPYNETGEIFVKTLRKKLITKLKELGLTIDDSPKNYTSAKLYNNIAEIHYVTKSKSTTKFDVILDYNALNDKLKENCKRIPDTYKWSLNGKYSVNSERSLNNVIEKIKYIIENKHHINIQEKIFNNENKKGVLNMKNNPLNQILYGPPGTGKTYNTVLKAMSIIGLEDCFKNWYRKNSDAKNIEKTLVDYIKHIYKINTEYLISDNIFSYISLSKYDIIYNEILNSDYIKNDPVRANSNSYYQHALKRYYEFLKQLTYDDLKNEFDRLKKEGQIQFVTFHQSYSYEEFIEGIKPFIPEWGNDFNKDLAYLGNNGIFKNICKQAETNLKIKSDGNNIQSVAFNTVLEIFKEKYPKGSDLENLLNISYDDDNLIYHFGKQTQDRKIDLSNIKRVFELNKQFRNSITFNKEYGGNIALKGYYYTFYKELINIKNAIENDNKISMEDNNEYIINPDAPRYVLIIDEINRGNISKIFGELITLIEEDKRIGNLYQMKVTLPYSKEEFGVPKNLYILGTMNTSDRSIASIDIALRRRFKFVEIMPDSNLVANFGYNFKECFEILNTKIKILLDRDHQIGHSYFIKTKYENAGIEELKQIWFDSVIPLLNEYFYSDWEKLQAILGNANKNGFIKKINTHILNGFDLCENDSFDFNYNCDFKEAMENAFGDIFKQENNENT